MTTPLSFTLKKIGSGDITIDDTNRALSVGSGQISVPVTKNNATRVIRVPLYANPCVACRDDFDGTGYSMPSTGGIWESSCSYNFMYYVHNYITYVVPEISSSSYQLDTSPSISWGQLLGMAGGAFRAEDSSEWLPYTELYKMYTVLSNDHWIYSVFIRDGENDVEYEAAFNISLTGSYTVRAYFFYNSSHYLYLNLRNSSPWLYSNLSRIVGYFDDVSSIDIASPSSIGFKFSVSGSTINAYYSLNGGGYSHYGSTTLVPDSDTPSIRINYSAYGGRNQANQLIDKGYGYIGIDHMKASGRLMNGDTPISCC